MSIHRFQTQGFTHYEGVLSQPANLKYLRERFATDKEFSATQLEGYAQCPYRFWVTDVLKIGEVESPDQFTDYGLRGDIVHEVLLQLHSRLEPTAEAVPMESAVVVFRELLQQRLADEYADTDLLAALLRIEQRLLEEWGDEYAQQWNSYHAAINEQSGAFLKPSLFEISFGTPHSPAPDEEIRPGLTLGHAGAETRIRGRIDRIDVGEINGQPVFNIIDYKTGRKPATAASQVKAGRTLQLILYALATQRLNLAGDNAIPLQAGYWCLRETGWTPLSKAPKIGPDGIQQHADWLALVDVLDDLVPRLAAGIRLGAFPVFNSDAACATYCPYKTTCRVSQIRPLAESLGKEWEA
jgi:ATP-dependent helicase/DNAse subunit B